MGALKIEILRDGRAVDEKTVDGELAVGRSDDCVIRLEDHAVSRNHALLKPVDGGVEVQKKSDFAGVQVNGIDVTQALVRRGDVIAIGPYLLRLKDQVSDTSVGTQEPSRSSGPPPEGVSQTMMLGESQHSPLAPLTPEENSIALAPLGLDASSEAPSEAPVEIQQEDLPGDSPVELPVDSPMDLQVNSNESLSLESSVVAPDGATQVLPAAAVDAKLVFAPGAANVVEYTIEKDEISIGRSKKCDVVLNDKRASRKHTIIRRVGNTFIVQDLGSSNGTWVNGERIQEHALSGDDQIRIADVEFQFVAISKEYEAKQADFISIPEEPVIESAEAFPQPAEIAVPDLFMQSPEAPVPTHEGAMPLVSGGMQIPELTTQPGIHPAPQPAATGKQSLIDKIRNMPRQQRVRILFIVIFAFFAWDMLFEEEAPPPPPKKQIQKKGEEVIRTFESLTPEEKRFVESQHQLAFDHFRNKNFDTAVFEVQKIFKYVQDYKNSREIERYALEGKRRLEAEAEDKRRKEEEVRIKEKVKSLEDEATKFMDKKLYEQAERVFVEILAVDPENPKVAQWQREIESWKEQKRLKEQEKQVQEQINAEAWGIYREGMELKKKEELISAMDTLARVPDTGTTDQKLLAQAKKQIEVIQKILSARLRPVLRAAKEKETAGELPAAYRLYEKATMLDPRDPVAYEGMSRIKGVLHEQAKVLYTEGVLAESYSDFKMARAKFEEVLEMAPKDDSYYERASNKLKRYVHLKDEKEVQY